MTKRLFTAGEVVICINDDFRWADKKYYPLKLNWPTFGSRYIVRGYVIDGKFPAIVVQGITNPPVPYSDGKVREAGFSDVRFAKAPPPIVINHETSIEEEMV